MEENRQFHVNMLKHWCTPAASVLVVSVTEEEGEDEGTEIVTLTMRDSTANSRQPTRRLAERRPNQTSGGEARHLQ